MSVLKLITTSKNGKPIHIDESQNIVIGEEEFVLGGKSLDRPITGEELSIAMDSFALLHPRVNDDGELEYYCGNGNWIKVENE